MKKKIKGTNFNQNLNIFQKKKEKKIPIIEPNTTFALIFILHAMEIWRERNPTEKFEDTKEKKEWKPSIHHFLVSIRYSSPEIQKKEKTFDEEEGELQKKKRRKIAKEEEEYLTFEPFLLLMKKKDYCMTNQSICPSRKVEALKQVEEKINLTKEYQSNYKCNLSTKL